MSRLRFLKGALLCGFLYSGCASEIVVRDIERPFVTAVSPKTILQSENATIEIQFSEPVINTQNMERCFRFAKTNEVSKIDLQRVSKMPKKEVAEPFISISAYLSDTRDLATIAVAQKLDYNESYSVWIFNCFTDDVGRSLVLDEGSLAYLEYRFVVEDGPFKLLSHNLSLNGHANVPPNRKHFTFHLSHPVAVLPENAVEIAGIATSSVLSEDRKSLYVSLANRLDACEILPPNAKLNVTFSSQIRDDAARPLMEKEIAFQTSESCQLNKSEMLQDVQVLAYEHHVEMSFNTVNFAFAKMKFGPLASTPILLESFKRQAFLVEGLLPFMSYEYEIEVENLFGQRDFKRGEVKTRPVAQIAINEIFAHPVTKSGQTDSGSEFIEIYNYGEESVDLSRFSLSLGIKKCPLVKDASLESLMLPAKSYLLIVGKKFDPRNHDMDDNPAIYRMHGQTICGNIRNWPLPNLVIKDDQERVVDQFLGMQKASEKGYSIERLNPSQKNGKEEFCYSRSDLGPTPLRMNGVLEKGCEKI